MARTTAKAPIIDKAVQAELARKGSIAALSMSPEMRAAECLPAYGNHPKGDMAQLLAETVRQVIKAKAGDYSRGVETLVAQAQTLDAMFQWFLDRAKDSESFLRLALKAQNQCRMAWEAVAMIQSPANKPKGNGNGRTKAKQAARK